jgi:hypothetical protein
LYLISRTISDLFQGVLVHFSEARANNLTPPSESESVTSPHDHSKHFLATTPWIAMIPCDFNSSTASLDEDVFTLARDKGAKAAVSTAFPRLYFSSLLDSIVPIVSSCTRHIHSPVSSIQHMQTPRLLIKSSTYFLHKVSRVLDSSSISLGNLVQPTKPHMGGTTRSSSTILRLQSISRFNSDIPLRQAIYMPPFKPITRLRNLVIPPTVMGQPIRLI